MTRLLTILLLPTLLLGQTRLPLKQGTPGKYSIPLSLTGSAATRIKSLPLNLSKGVWTYALSAATVTSAGVVNAAGILAKTLWNGRSQTTGTHVGYWDGKDDAGNTLTGSGYSTVTQLSQTTYTWKGVIGNTSTNATGLDNWHNLTFINNIAIAGNYAYVSTQEGELRPATNKFLLTSPGVKIPIPINFAISFEECRFIAADNSKVYWLMRDALSTKAEFGSTYKQGVVATSQSTDAVITFPSGMTVATTQNGTFSNVADYTASQAADATGMAVQKSGNYLFVAHGGLNEIHVINKSTGALVQTISSFTNPRELVVDGSDRLWVTSGTNTVARYTVAGNGTLSADGVSLPGLVAPMALAVSQDGVTISVLDGSTSQQEKRYSVSSGTLTGTFGQAGGYASTATVSNDRFYFSDAAGRINKTSIAYGPNGDVWILDSGNNRLQHYDNTRAYVNRLSFQDRTYTIAVDKNNTSRVFRGFMEFEVDYTKPMVDGQGWTLKRNYWAQVPANINPYSQTLYNFYTDPLNSRAYGLSRNDTQGQSELVELTATSPRFSGVFVSYTDASLLPDGSLWTSPAYTGGSSAYQWTKRTRTGFDASGNHQWGTAVVQAQITNPVDAVDPLYRGVPEHLSAGEVTASGKLVSFNGQPATPGNSQFRGGLVPLGGTAWGAKFLPVTGAGYLGNFSTDGRFETGNYVKNAGSKALALGESIIIGQRAENYRNSGQANWYQHWTSAGLLAGNFGTAQADQPDSAQAGVAGNAYAMQLIPYPGDANKMLLLTGDESRHSGIHVWEIGGLNTIQTITTPVSVPITDAKPADPRGTDLLAGLPLSSTLTSGTGGWVRSPTAENNTAGQIWNVNTGGYTYDRPGLFAWLAGSTKQTGTVSYDLGTVSATSYTVTADIGSAEYGALDYGGAGAWLEVLDNTGKVIARYSASQDLGSPFLGYIKGNTTTLYANGYQTMQRYVRDTHPVTIVVNSSGVSFNLAGRGSLTSPLVDSGADYTKPKTIRLYLQSADGGGGGNKQIVLTRLYFKTN